MAVDKDTENQAPLALPLGIAAWAPGLSQAVQGVLGTAWALPGTVWSPELCGSSRGHPRNAMPVLPAELSVCAAAAAAFGAQGLAPVPALSSFSSPPSARLKNLIELRFILIRLEICLRAFSSLDVLLKMK